MNSAKRWCVNKTIIALALVAAALGLEAAHSAPLVPPNREPILTRPGKTLFDELMPLFGELMPRPVRVEAAATDETSVVPVAVLGNVTVIRGQVPGAPAATADEAYVLEIESDGAKITASGSFGEIWARVTLDQLVRLAQNGRVPCGRITDWPRLKWRGFMLDSVRNYLPPQGVKDVIDVMSRYKLNLFHWHLTENYAWRLESKRFPELQSERAFLHRHKGKFYTQEEFKEIVDYAYARGVRVMPEFDFPGHALAFRRAFGFKTMSDPASADSSGTVKSGVAEKAAALFEELCSLAPKEKMPFIHMGTDEVFKREIEGAPRETLERMAKSIADGGRTMVSWVPGEEYASPGPRINMLWTDKVSPDKNPGAYFDAIGMYIEDFDPFELLSVAVYHKAARWHDAGDLNQGAIFCAWHDGFVGLPYENLLRNQPVFPSCVLFGDTYWHGRDNDLPQFRKRLPLGGDPLLAEAAVFVLELAVLLREGLRLEGAVEDGVEVVEVDGLREEVVGTLLHRLDGRFDAAVGREEDADGLRVLRADGLEEIEAVHAGHADVREHDFDVAVGEFVHRHLGVGREADVETELQRALESLARVAVVVYNQYCWLLAFDCHGWQVVSG